MAGREIRAITKGESQAEEIGDQKDSILHFAGLRKLVGVQKVYLSPMLKKKEWYIPNGCIGDIPRERY